MSTDCPLCNTFQILAEDGSEKVCPICDCDRLLTCPACDAEMVYSQDHDICPECYFTHPAGEELPDQSWREVIPIAGIYNSFHTPEDALRQLWYYIREAEEALEGDGLEYGSSLAGRIMALKEDCQGVVKDVLREVLDEQFNMPTDTP